jgi:hypothetical protein
MTALTDAHQLALVLLAETLGQQPQQPSIATLVEAHRG